MCLITAQKEAMIAEQDITVYKLFNVELTPEGEKTYTSPFQYTGYRLNELYKTTIEDTDDDAAFDEIDRNKLNEVFRDSHDRPNWHPYWYTGSEPADVKRIGQGFHAMITLERAIPVLKEWDHSRKIVECTIPAGSEYYLNPSGLIVSNQIIVLKEVSIELPENNNLYTVWVGGLEVNDSLLSKEAADNLAEEYRNNGHDDVIVQKAVN